MSQFQITTRFFVDEKQNKKMQQTIAIDAVLCKRKSSGKTSGLIQVIHNFCPAERQKENKTIGHYSLGLDQVLFLQQQGRPQKCIRNKKPLKKTSGSVHCYICAGRAKGVKNKRKKRALASAFSFLSRWASSAKTMSGPGSCRNFRDCSPCWPVLDTMIRNIA